MRTLLVTVFFAVGVASAQTGTGVKVAQVESAPATAYAPNPAITVGPRPGFNLALKSGPSPGSNSHADGVAWKFYGTDSVATGVTDAEAWNANHWLTNGFLFSNNNLPPTTGVAKVSNHSYVGNAGANTGAYLLRVDYLVDHGGQNVVAAAGDLGNQLLGGALNAVAVGNSWGGGYRPAVTAPYGILSDSTPWVAATVTTLAGAEPTAKPQTIKAVLMAGAVKAGLGAAWSGSPLQPLDPTYGSGEANYTNSHRILTGGKPPKSGTFTTTSGWDQGRLGGRTKVKLYRFTVTDCPVASAALVWNRQVSKNLSSSLGNADLRLYRLDEYGAVTGLPLGESVGGVNAEHVWIPNGLPAGRYAWEVRLVEGECPYGFAFRTK